MDWESSEDVEAILAQGYSRLRDCVPYIIDWGELRGSSVIVPVRSTPAGQIQNFTVLPSTSAVQWGTFYQVIGMANAVLKYAPGVIEKDESYYQSQMDSHLTEAYFLRGYNYYRLFCQYERCPLQLEPIDVSAGVPRIPVLCGVRSVLCKKRERNLTGSSGLLH